MPNCNQQWRSGSSSCCLCCRHVLIYDSGVSGSRHTRRFVMRMCCFDQKNVIYKHKFKWPTIIPHVSLGFSNPDSPADSGSRYPVEVTYVCSPGRSLTSCSTICNNKQSDGNVEFHKLTGWRLLSIRTSVGVLREHCSVWFDYKSCQGSVTIHWLLIKPTGRCGCVRTAICPGVCTVLIVSINYFSQRVSGAEPQAQPAWFTCFAPHLDSVFPAGQQNIWCIWCKM